MKWIIGIDEVGRGPVAGPVCLCAVAMPVQEYKNMRWHKAGSTLTDSKKMAPSAREKWHAIAKQLEKNKKIKIAVAMRSANVIDEKGISLCIKSCINSILTKLAIDPKDCLVLLDGGLKAPVRFTSQRTVIRGDATHKIIAFASVVAKVRRDAVMKRLHKAYPSYAWAQNKGYGTALHMAALREKGLTPIHRKSFLSKGF